MEFLVDDLYVSYDKCFEQLKFFVGGYESYTYIDRGQVVELRDFLNKVLDKMPGSDTIDT